MTTSTNVSVEELQNIPSSRDPWVVLQTVPGIIVDRVNVGGAESGQQSSYQAKGATGADNTWNIDGIAITDMAATGSTPTYYDFDMFQEMQVTTGGADVMSATPGVQLNMVLKSGSNTPHGSTRIYFENERPAVEQHAGRSRRVDWRHQRQGQPDAPVQGLRLRARRPDHEGPAVGVGRGRQDARGPDHADRRATTAPSCRTRRSRRPARSHRASAPTSPTSAATRKSSAAARPRTGRRKRPTTRRARRRSTRAKATSSSAPTSSCRPRRATTRGGFSLTAEGGADKNWYVDDCGVYHGTVDTYVTDRPQSNLSARRQHVPRAPRAEVRLRLAQGRGRLDRHLPGQRDHHATTSAIRRCWRW